MTFNIVGKDIKEPSERRFDKKETGKTQSDILLVDQDLAWHHFSPTTALWSGDFDVQLFEEVYVETEKIISKNCRVEIVRNITNSLHFASTLALDIVF